MANNYNILNLKTNKFSIIELQSLDSDNEMLVEVENKWGDIISLYLNVDELKLIRDFINQQLQELESGSSAAVKPQ